MTLYGSRTYCQHSARFAPSNRDISQHGTFMAVLCITPCDERFIFFCLSGTEKLFAVNGVGLPTYPVAVEWLATRARRSPLKNAL